MTPENWEVTASAANADPFVGRVLAHYRIEARLGSGGTPLCAGGMCATLRDLARVGRWLVEERPALFQQLETAGDEKAWTQGDLAKYFPRLPMRYRSQWYVLEGAAPLVFGLGSYGQNLFIDRANRIVIAKFSSQAAPFDAPRLGLTMRAVSQLRKFLG